MFDSIIERKDKRPQRLKRLFSASVGLHGLVLGGVLVADQLRVSVVPEPAVTVTFVDFSAAPPPPPPPPPKKRSAPKKVEPKPEQQKPTEVVAPAQIPEQEPPPEDNADESGSDEGSDTGSDDGVEGGVEGGVVGGVGTALPPPPPDQPIFQEMDFVKKNLIAGAPAKYPPMAQRNRIEGVVLAKIFIGVDGRVTGVEIVQTHAAFERTVRDAVATWVFKPHYVDGRAVPIYTLYRFVFKLPR